MGKLRDNPGSEQLDLYEFEMALFNNSNPEEFLLFVFNFIINLEASGTLQTGANTQYQNNSNGP